MGLLVLKTLRRIPAVPRSADFWRLLGMDWCIYFLQNNFRFFWDCHKSLGPSALIMIGLIVTAFISQIFFISWAKSVYFYTFLVYLFLTRTSAGIATSIMLNLFSLLLGSTMSSHSSLQQYLVCGCTTTTGLYKPM